MISTPARYDYMKTILLFLLSCLVATAQEPTPVKKPAASDTKAKWVAYATYLEARAAYLETEVTAAKIDSSKIGAILETVVSIDAKISAIPPPTPPPVEPPPPPSTAAPTITKQPVETLVAAAGTGVLSVEAAGTAPLAYQWYKDGAAIPGGVAATIALAGFSLNDVGLYHVVVRNYWGDVTSEGVSVKLAAPTEPPPPPPPLPPPFIDTADVLVGQDVVLQATADGVPVPTYTWQKDGVQVPGGYTDILAFTPVTLADAGAYTVVATNLAGSTEASLTLIVKPAP
jgi:hypothetical protein